jgi:hypothetical protein
MKRLLGFCAVFAAGMALAGDPLHEAMDEGLEVAVDEIVIRNGEGAWTRDAQWDEYRIRIKAQGAPVQVRDVTLLTSRGSKVAPRTAAMLDAARVKDEIERRRTPLPITIAAGEEKQLTLFFPITPRPRGAEIAYTDARGEHRLALDTKVTLGKVHVDPPPKLVSRSEPDFPVAAVRSGHTSGRVKARLTIAPNGSVDKVEILESQPPGFEWEAAKAMTYWRYDEATFGYRSAVETLDFKR